MIKWHENNSGDIEERLYNIECFLGAFVLFGIPCAIFFLCVLGYYNAYLQELQVTVDTLSNQ